MNLETSLINLLNQIRNGLLSKDDWKLMLSRSPHNCRHLLCEPYPLKLSYGNNTVINDNYESLINLGKPIARIDALHNQKRAEKCTSDDMGGLQITLMLSIDARVMLTRNLWTDAGLCNGALGKVYSIVYSENNYPPHLPIAVLVQFDNYKGPSFLSFLPNVVPIPPSSSTSESLGLKFERTQFPLKLAWAITIHKSQGLTLDKIHIDLGQSEKSHGLTYVALSRAKCLQGIVIEPISYERLVKIGQNETFKFRLDEEKRLEHKSSSTMLF